VMVAVELSALRFRPGFTESKFATRHEPMR
jgi:hypothetical protein